MEKDNFLKRLKPFLRVMAFAWLALALWPFPVYGQQRSSGAISPYVFVPSDIAAFVTLDMQRFFEMKELKAASGVWGELYREFGDNAEYRKFKDKLGIDPLRDVQSMTLVAFSGIGSRTDEMAAIFKFANDREKLMASFDTLDSYQKIPGFREYEDIPLFQLDPGDNESPVYLAFPGEHHAVFGYKHEVKRVLAVLRGERPNVLARYDIQALNGPSGKQPVFQVLVFFSKDIIDGLKKMKLPVDLQGASAAQLTLDSDFLAFRLMIDDPADTSRIATFVSGIKALSQGMNPKNDQEKSLLELGAALEISATPAGLSLRLPTGQTIPKVEAAIAHELQMNLAISKGRSTQYNMQLIANSIEIYLLTHPTLPACRSLQELKQKSPGIFSNYEFELPETDGWDHAILFKCDGVSYTIASAGSDNQFAGWDQPVGDYTVQAPDDCKRDYIFTNGKFSVTPVWEK